MNVLEVAVTEAFGERCPDYEPECPCCMAWKALDNSERQSKLIDELTIALSESADEIETWGAYAAEYFQGKHDLRGVVQGFRDIVSKAQSHKPNEGQRDEP